MLLNTNKYHVLQICNQKVVGSIPIAGTNEIRHLRQPFGAGVLLSGGRVSRL